MTEQFFTSTEVHTDEKCVYNYCPYPELCREKGARTDQPYGALR